MLDRMTATAITAEARVTWTPELDDRLRSLVANGNSDVDVANELGASAGAVRHRRFRLGIKRRPADAIVWTNELVARLIELRADGYSARQIAEKIGFGISKKAVIGKAHRLKLPRLPRGKTPLRARKAAPKPAKRPWLSFDIDNKPDTEIPIEQRVSFMELNDTTCRWPVGEPGHDLFFCGAMPLEGRPYCAAHTARAYGGNTRKT